MQFIFGWISLVKVQGSFSEQKDQKVVFLVICKVCSFIIFYKSLEFWKWIEITTGHRDRWITYLILVCIWVCGTAWSLMKWIWLLLSFVLIFPPDCVAYLLVQKYEKKVFPLNVISIPLYELKWHKPSKEEYHLDCFHYSFYSRLSFLFCLLSIGQSWWFLWLLITIMAIWHSLLKQ